MIKCLAIYPHIVDKVYIERVKETSRLAYKYGFNEVFTTLHLPEYSIEDQLKTLEIISNERKRYGFELTVDIGGNYISKILNDEKKCEFVRKQDIDFIRLDYGYNFLEVKELYKKLNIKGFVINASIYSEDEVDDCVKKFKEIDKNIKLRACHNYYVRKDSGIDEVFALKQDSYFKKYNMPIYYCLPSHTSPRGPLHLGLCTLEKHRFMDLDDIVVDLYLNFDLNALMVADQWLSEDEYKSINNTLVALEEKLPNIVDIKVEFLNGASKEEKEIVLKEHKFRYDSPFYLLRSVSSRQMAEFAKEIDKNNVIKRKKGYITIDNVLNKRYSGELEVVLKDTMKDDGANVVARIVDDKDIIKLFRYKEGLTYRFIEG